MKVKYFDNYGENIVEKVVEFVEMSLKELGIDCIDLLYLYWLDCGVLFVEILEVVDKLYKQGKFLRLGISNFIVYEVVEVVMICKYNGWVCLIVYQVSKIF